MLLGIAGGTASCKTTFARKFREASPRGEVAVVPLDCYYKHKPELTFPERCQQNYDHPDAFDIELLVAHIKLLKAGKEISMPLYNFAKHLRDDKTELVRPCRVIIVEGILTFHWEALRALFDYKVFIEVPDDIRFQRRMNRDIRERGRSKESVEAQWGATVQPMHLEYCVPTKRFADRVIPGDDTIDVSVREVVALLFSDRASQ